MLDKILVPLDGSDLAEKILLHVNRILLRRDSEVVLVNVVPELAPDNRPSTVNPLQLAHGYLERVKARLEGEGARVSTRVLVGDPATKILEAAHTVTPDLICLSTHGRSGVTRLVRGSVAERVLRSSPFPVMTANPAALPDAAKARFAKILVPLDGSELSTAILPLVRRVAELYESEVVLHHAIELVVTAAPGEGSVAVVEDEGAVKKLLESYLPRLAPAKARVLTTTGSAVTAILDAVEKEKPDLVAMTTHGRSGLSRWVFGSVAENILRHCTAPLLVKRTSTSLG